MKEKKRERESQMENEMESCYHVTGGHGAGQGAEWAIRGQHNGVVIAREQTFHKADPGSVLEERR